MDTQLEKKVNQQNWKQVNICLIYILWVDLSTKTVASGQIIRLTNSYHLLIKNLIIDSKKSFTTQIQQMIGIYSL